MGLRPPLPVSPPRPRPAVSRHRRQYIIAALIASAVGIAGIVAYDVTEARRFTGFRVSAPGDDCWTSVLSYGYRTLTNWTGCGSAVFPAQCFHDYYMYGIFTKVTPGNWTLTVSLQIGGTYYETGSVSEPFARTLVQGNHC